jgi:hypothetical protein
MNHSVRFDSDRPEAWSAVAWPGGVFRGGGPGPAVDAALGHLDLPVPLRGERRRASGAADHRHAAPRKERPTAAPPTCSAPRAPVFVGRRRCTTSGSAPDRRPSAPTCLSFLFEAGTGKLWASDECAAALLTIRPPRRTDVLRLPRLSGTSSLSGSGGSVPLGQCGRVRRPRGTPSPRCGLARSGQAVAAVASRPRRREVTPTTRSADRRQLPCRPFATPRD